MQVEAHKRVALITDKNRFIYRYPPIGVYPYEWVLLILYELRAGGALNAVA